MRPSLPGSKRDMGHTAKGQAGRFAITAKGRRHAHRRSGNNSPAAIGHTVNNRYRAVKGPGRIVGDGDPEHTGFPGVTARRTGFLDGNIPRIIIARWFVRLPDRNGGTMNRPVFFLRQRGTVFHLMAVGIVSYFDHGRHRQIDGRRRWQNDNASRADKPVWPPIRPTTPRGCRTEGRTDRCTVRIAVMHGQHSAVNRIATIPDANFIVAGSRFPVIIGNAEIIQPQLVQMQFRFAAIIAGPAIFLLRIARAFFPGRITGRWRWRAIIVTFFTRRFGTIGATRLTSVPGGRTVVIPVLTGRWWWRAVQIDRDDNLDLLHTAQPQPLFWAGHMLDLAIGEAIGNEMYGHAGYSPRNMPGEHAATNRHDLRGREDRHAGRCCHKLDGLATKFGTDMHFIDEIAGMILIAFNLAGFHPEAGRGIIPPVPAAGVVRAFGDVNHNFRRLRFATLGQGRIVRFDVHRAASGLDAQVRLIGNTCRGRKFAAVDFGKNRHGKGALARYPQPVKIGF